MSIKNGLAILDKKISNCEVRFLLEERHLWHESTEGKDAFIGFAAFCEDVFFVGYAKWTIETKGQCSFLSNGQVFDSSPLILGIKESISDYGWEYEIIRLSSLELEEKAREIVSNEMMARSIKGLSPYNEEFEMDNSYSVVEKILRFLEAAEDIDVNIEHAIVDALVKRVRVVGV